MTTPANRNACDSNFTYPPDFGSGGSVRLQRGNDSPDPFGRGADHGAIHDPKAGAYVPVPYTEDND